MILAAHAVGLLASGAEPNPNPLVPDPAEMIFGSFGFLVVLFVLGKFLVPRIQRQLEERTEAIEGGLRHAEEAQTEAKRALEQYRAKLAEARHEASRLREEAREQGAQIIAEMREQAEANARRIVDSAHAQIQTERQQALNQLRAEIGALSVELAGRVVGEALEDEARRRRTVERFLSDLEERARTEQVSS
jgi:F-type H+-transporting ATPase subunit b